MNWLDFSAFILPPLFMLGIGEYAISRLVGKRCASWFGIGCIVGMAASFGGLMLGVFVL